MAAATTDSCSDEEINQPITNMDHQLEKSSMVVWQDTELILTESSEEFNTDAEEDETITLRTADLNTNVETTKEATKETTEEETRDRSPEILLNRRDGVAKTRNPELFDLDQPTRGSSPHTNRRQERTVPRPHRAKWAQETPIRTDQVQIHLKKGRPIVREVFGDEGMRRYLHLDEGEPKKRSSDGEERTSSGSMKSRRAGEESRNGRHNARGGGRTLDPKGPAGSRGRRKEREVTIRSTRGDRAGRDVVEQHARGTVFRRLGKAPREERSVEPKGRGTARGETAQTEARNMELETAIKRAETKHAEEKRLWKQREAALESFLRQETARGWMEAEGGTFPLRHGHQPREAIKPLSPFLQQWTSEVRARCDELDGRLPSPYNNLATEDNREALRQLRGMAATLAGPPTTPTFPPGRTTAVVRGGPPLG